MKPLLISGLLALALTAIARAESSPPAADTKQPDPGQHWIFALLPKTFQKNPKLELTAITEMTANGRKLPVVTPEHPAYYVLSSNGYHQQGETSSREKPMAQTDVARLLEKALAANGYHPGEPGKPPTLVIYYTWGTHNTLEEADEDNPVHSGAEIARNLLDRAALVGGEKFAREVLRVIRETDDMNTAAMASMGSGGQPPISPEMFAFSNPLNLFRLHSAKNDLMINQSANNVYYVVASAYDLATLAEKKLLLWRTRMTVSSNGLAQEQSVPAMIATAAPFFGRDMTEPEIVVRRVLNETNIKIGEAVVVPDATSGPPANQPPPAKK
jgi:hypothetical protein